MRSLWRDFQEWLKYFQNFFEVPLQFFSKITRFYRKIIFSRFLYLFKVFREFLPNFFPISLKLFQKNYLKFLHKINKINFELLKFCWIIFPSFSWNRFKFSSQFLLNFFKIFLQFSQNFIKLPQKLLQVDSKNLKNFLKNLCNISNE